ncbi:MAG: hypothetical protein M5Z89_10910 [Olivibacter sp.]|nr:hypothetical protein [Olivibacter sp. UJ_SKK_5.1]
MCSFIMTDKDYTLDSTFPIDAIELIKTYNVMDLRLQYGYSHFELSFLMGLRDFYVRDAENPLHSLQYSVPNNNYLQLIFNCGINKILPKRTDSDKYTIRVFTAEVDGLISYRIEKLESDGNWSLFREFSEESKLIELPLDSSISETAVREFIQGKFANGYFKTSKTALDVFQLCKKHFKEAIKPLYVANALKVLTSKRKSPKLGTKKTEMGRTIYLKV